MRTGYRDATTSKTATQANVKAPVQKDSEDILAYDTAMT